MIRSERLRMIIKKEREGDRKGAKKKRQNLRKGREFLSWAPEKDWMIFLPILSSFQDCSYHKIHSVKQ